MRFNLFYLFLAVALLLSPACSPAEPEPAPEAPAAEPAPATDAGADPSGTWSGDWGPSANDRNDVTLELNWDGTNLTGTVNPGPNAVQLGASSFNPSTGAIMMQADAQGRGGATVHYTIEGTVQGNSMSGSWGHDNVMGDFSLTKN
jgi:hypothetical protein